ncbi:MAG: acyl-CoA thioester hydrolase [Candidatus Arcticimaribacter sp.]|jgi:acyl-CoA thioester hydrolase|tara:strand:- start:120 stop:560 length:441 start_codon:yes stop_codon:yes gene_type:complete
MKDNKNSNRNVYKHFHPITTRWMDNDVFGHINNVTYYSYFDTAVNQYLTSHAGFSIKDDPIVGYVVHSECTYLSGISFPDQIEIGLRVDKLGNSSVTYALAVFRKGEANAAAYGTFVHVFVNRKEEKSVSIPKVIKAVLQELLLFR